MTFAYEHKYRRRLLKAVRDVRASERKVTLDRPIEWMFGFEGTDADPDTCDAEPADTGGAGDTDHARRRARRALHASMGASVAF